MAFIPYRHPLLNLLGLNNRRALLPDVKYETAIKIADERRVQLQRILTEIGDAGFVRQEFLEAPPKFELAETRSLADTPPEAYAQTVRLRWQLKADELLLLERVIDAIVTFKRLKSPVSTQREQFDEYLCVKVEHLGRVSRERGLFPWRVIIETDNPTFYKEVFHSLSDWVGIGIDLAPANKVELFGQCQIPEGMEGVVGGLIVGQEEYGMTCSHVISPHCGSLAFKGDPSLSGQQPDAALINSATDCFDLGARRSNKRTINVAPNLLIDSCILNKTKVINLNFHKSSTGFVLARVGTFTVGKVLYRFPHLQVISKRVVLGFVTIPFIYKYFSEPGKSGSWIGEKDTDSWIGMIVGGSRNPPLSYLAESEPLVQFFELLLTQKSKLTHSKLSAYRFT
jgi:hypothetical protein